jgi:hypothetical protein
MSDDKTKTGKADRIRINIHEDHELSYWSSRFEKPREEIISASHVVGPMVKDIAKYLGIAHVELATDVDYVTPEVEVTYIPPARVEEPKAAPQTKKHR